MKLNLPEEYQTSSRALLWKRIAAFLIDLLIINFVVLFPFKGALEEMFSAANLGQMLEQISSDPALAAQLTTASFLISLLFISYFVLFESKYGQSIGKKLMGLYVASLTKEKGVRFWQHLVRNVVFLPIFPFILLWIIDPLFMIFSRSNQRLTEILSKTEVAAKEGI
ncbi:RDD family protein [Candidatus Woesearchaeota archaeon]|nr:RDD family protein [Candidatus Woesearchaeota archaeon]